MTRKGLWPRRRHGSLYYYYQCVYIICAALKHINLIGQAIYIVTLKHRGLGRPEEMIRHDQRTGATIVLYAVAFCSWIMFNDY